MRERGPVQKAEANEANDRYKQAGEWAEEYWEIFKYDFQVRV